MNTLMASLLIAIGIAKPVKKTKKQISQDELEQVTLPEGFDRTLEVERRRLRSFRPSSLTIPLMIIVIIGGAIILGIILAGMPHTNTVSPDQAADNKIDAMSCIDLKKYYESASDTQSGEGYRSWLVYNGTKGWDIHHNGCYSQTGYLKGQEERIKDLCADGFFSGCTTTEMFPRDGNTVTFPSDWFYIDNTSGKVISDPNEYLKLVGSPLTGTIHRITPFIAPNSTP
jgi:hypothetical protein